MDGGKPVAGLNNPNAIAWGKTLGGTFNVWRSGLGITADGALVYVGGPGFRSATSPTRWCARGRCAAWSSTSTPTGSSTPPTRDRSARRSTARNGTNLLPSMIGNPGRFFANWWTRDFFVMSLRPKYQ